MPNAKSEILNSGSIPSLRTEELAAQRTAFHGRLVALTAIAFLITMLTPWPGPVYFYFLLAVFTLLGWGAYQTAQSSWGRPWHQYGFVTADFALLTFTLLYPNPLLLIELPPQFALRFGSFIYFFTLLAGLAYVYRPQLVLWGGVSAAISWSIGIGFLLALPDTIWRGQESGTAEAVIGMIALPTFIDLGVRVQEVVVLLIVAGLLALAVKRSRAVALRQANLARERANLARYFPVKTADMLAGQTNPFSQPREHHSAVLFADLVAFTTWSEKRRPTQTIEVLREVHGLLAKIIFKHDGTLDKFIGDGLMATFGTPEPTKEDAFNALSAMIEMADAFETWRLAQFKTNDDTLKLAIGLHYGPVVIGDIGSDQRLEFAVLGDTVNVASRLEAATREVGCRCLVSGDLVEAAKVESPSEVYRHLDRLRSHNPISLRGRSAKLPVFVLP